MRKDELWLIGVLLLLPVIMYPIYRYHGWLTGERGRYWPWFFSTVLSMILMKIAMNCAGGK